MRLIPFFDWLPDDRFPFFRRRFPDVTQINLVVFFNQAVKCIAFIFNKAMKLFDGWTFSRKWADVHYLSG